MSDWDYVVGETGYNQPFIFYDKGTKLQYVGTGITTATITILKSDLTAATPAVTDASMSIDTLDPLRVIYAVTTANMPQTAGAYVAIITTSGGGQTRKTFEVDLRVHRG